MKDKRNYALPSNRLMRRHLGEVVELLEFNVKTQSGLNTWFININKVIQVMPCPPKITEAGGGSSFLGTIHARNETFPLYCLSTLLGHGSNENYLNSPTLLIQLSGHKFALLVNSVRRIHYVQWSEIQEHANSNKDHSIGTVLTEERQIPMIDLETVIAPFLESELNITEAKPRTDSANYHIAVVDDSFTARKTTTETLRNLGYPVKAFSSAHAFLKYNEKEQSPFQLLITDIEMPGMSGLELIQKLGDQHTKTDTVVLSSLEGHDIKTSSFNSGAKEWFRKNEVGNLVEWIRTHKTA